MRKDDLEKQFLKFVESLQVDHDFINWAEQWIDHFSGQKGGQLLELKKIIG
jgi:hypothetical protein